MTNKQRIAGKLNQLREDLQAITRGAPIVAVVGGPQAQRQQITDWHEARIANLEWAAGATDVEIRARIAELEMTLSDEEIMRKYGIVADLPAGAVLTISLIEDLEIALGIHPAQQEAD